MLFDASVVLLNDNSYFEQLGKKLRDNLLDRDIFEYLINNDHHTINIILIHVVNSFHKVEGIL